MRIGKASKKQSRQPEHEGSEEASEASSEEADEPKAHAASAAKKGKKPDIGELDRLGPPMSYAAALKRHRNHAQHLDAMLEAGEREHDTSFGILWPNACQWLRSAERPVHTLVETHDSAQRAKDLRKPGERALFGADVVFPAAASYNPTDTKDEQGVQTHLANSPGFHVNGQPGIFVVEPATKPREAVQRIIVHETQHDIDNPAGDWWSNYVSEFAAYWNGPEYRECSTKKGSADGSITTKDGTKLAGFANRRQQMIFYDLYELSDLYPYARDLWASGLYRPAILSMAEPDNLNLVLSPRLEHLKATLKDLKSTEDDFKAAIDGLTKEDAVAMQSSGSREPWEHLVRSLPAELKQYMRDRIGNGTWPAGY